MAGNVRELLIRIVGDSASGERAMRQVGQVAEQESAKMGDKFGAASARVGGAFASIGGMASTWLGLPLQAPFDRLNEKMSSVETKGKGLGPALASVGRGLTLGIGAAAIAVGVESVHMADQFEASHARLQSAVKASGESMKQWQGPIDATAQKLESLGFTHAQFDDALAHSVVSTQNVGKSLQTMGLAADLARLKHIDLTTATDALDKALTGNMRPLKQLGIDLPIQASNALKVKTATESLSKAQDALSQVVSKYPDAANAASKGHAQYEAAVKKVTDTQQKLKDLQDAHTQILDALTQRLGGQASAAADTFQGRLQVVKAQVTDLGAKFGTLLIPILEKLMKVVTDVVGWFEKHKAVAIALGVVVGTVLVAAVAAYALEMTVAAAATIAATWPILAIIAAVAAVIAVIVLLATHWSEVWNGIKTVAKDVWNFLWNTVFVPWRTEFDLLKAAVQGLGDLWGAIWNGMESVAKTVWQGIKGTLNLAISGINVLINGWNATAGNIPFIGSSLRIPDIPHLAAGGPVSAGSPYIVGEVGPELFVPNQSGRILPNSALGAAASQRNIHMENHFHTQADPQMIFREARWAMLTAPV